MHAFSAHYHHAHDILTGIVAGLAHVIGWLV
jgi:hypothetical protein